MTYGVILPQQKTEHLSDELLVFNLGLTSPTDDRVDQHLPEDLLPRLDVRLLAGLLLTLLSLRGLQRGHQRGEDGRRSGLGIAWCRLSSIFGLQRSNGQELLSVTNYVLFTQFF